MERRIIVSGIVSVTNKENIEGIEIRQGGKKYGLEKIVVKALGDMLPEDCFNQDYVGEVKVEIKLVGNTFKVSEGDIWSNSHTYRELEMEKKK